MHSSTDSVNDAAGKNKKKKNSTTQVGCRQTGAATAMALATTMATTTVATNDIAGENERKGLNTTSRLPTDGGGYSDNVGDGAVDGNGGDSDYRDVNNDNRHDNNVAPACAGSTTRTACTSASHPCARVLAQGLNNTSRLLTDGGRNCDNAGDGDADGDDGDSDHRDVNNDDRCDSNVTPTYAGSTARTACTSAAHPCARVLAQEWSAIHHEEVEHNSPSRSRPSLTFLALTNGIR